MQNYALHAEQLSAIATDVIFICTFCTLVIGYNTDF